MLPVCGLASSSDDPQTVLLGQMRLARSLLTVAQPIFGTPSDADQRERELFSFSFLLLFFSLPFSCFLSPFLFFFFLYPGPPVLCLELNAELCAYKAGECCTAELKERPEFVLSYVSEERGSIPRPDRGGEVHYCPTLYLAAGRLHILKFCFFLYAASLDLIPKL